MDSNIAALHEFSMPVDADGDIAEIERRALSFEHDQRFEEARDAYDAGLRLAPSSQSLAAGRARIALRLGESDAADHCARVLAFHDNDPELQEQMIRTATAQIGIAAIPLLENFLSRQPLRPSLQQLMADLKAQSGAGDDFTDNYRAALAQFPEDKPLLMSFWDTLSCSGRHVQAIESMDAHRALFDGNRDFSLLEAAIAHHAGLTERATRVLQRLDNGADVQLARGLNRLQQGLPAEAASFLEAVVSEEPDNLSAWCLLEVAWRVTNKERHEWLMAGNELYKPSQLDLSNAQLADIATMLRSMHRSTAHPIGQSLRGGTQTGGELFVRDEPELKLLTKALGEAIREFYNGLPPYDAAHPLLKHRRMGVAFSQSWSVRFTGSGYHAAHFHPGGIVSSACYICVPETFAEDSEQQGWLEIGRPASEVGIDLPPLASFEPKPGRLVLFPSFLFHGTRPFSGGERLTVAFDLIPVPMN